MKKYVLVMGLCAAVILLSLTDPFDFLRQYRDPVPQEQKVAHSSHCSGCHSVDPEGLALVDKDGNDVSIFDDWQISMMAFATKDPFWRATVVDEVNHYSAAQAAIESTCLKCHAPLGHYQALLNNQPYTFQSMLNDSLGLDGVSCNACHQQSPDKAGQFFSGDYFLDTNRLVFGHLPNPFQGPMQIYVGFDPVYSEHIYNSETCAGCHTLVTETLHPDGTPSGDYFVEQATYHEWLNSVYPAQNKECQTCHMPFLQEGVIIATELAALEPRQPFGLHQIFGANTAMLDMMRQYQKDLGLPEGQTDHAWEESISSNRMSLANAGALTINSANVIGDTLYVSVSVSNKAGHKLPSGYPSRLAWLQVLLEDESSADVIYQNGALDANGEIQHRDHPFEPHHEIAYSSDDVQIYELVMSDLTGHLTTRLNAAYEPLKDNRLLPLGFRTDHPTIDTVAVYGAATADPDYAVNSQQGKDDIEYRIPLNGAKGLGNLSVTLRYQTLPPRWMQALFSSDSLATVAHFKSMYQGYERFTEIIDSVRLDSIHLSSTGIAGVLPKTDFTLYPNPVAQQTLFIQFDTGLTASPSLHYRIMHSNGTEVQAGSLKQNITLSEKVTPGLYYLFLYKEETPVSGRPFVRL